uniref:glycosyltransferase n=1 Tax=Sphingomonas bacterium TaxID=1895847 RepID=UPI0015766823
MTLPATATATAPAIAIGIPVRDEQALLPRLLGALDTQRGIDGSRVTVAFLLDGCTDQSEALVRGWRTPFAVVAHAVPRGEPNAGRARRVAMKLAQASGAALLVTTDADSVPAPDWLAAIVRALADADLVAGRIIRAGSPHDAAQDAVERYYDRLHAHRRTIDPVAWDPAPGHHHTGGANLAFRADSFRALGGFDPVPSGEDALIVDRAHRLGLRVRREPAALVATSSRRCG